MCKNKPVTILWFFFTVQPRYNETLHNEVLGLTNSIFYPSYGKIYEKEPQY